MELVLSDMIKEIDRFAESELCIPEYALMQRSGAAVARAVRALCPAGSSVVILAGKGNNGADGYAAATELFSEYSVSVFDVLSSGQRSEGGKAHLSEYLSLGGRIVSGVDPAALAEADCIVDAIFGTGFAGELSAELSALARAVNLAHGKKVAVDVPLGVNADDGSVSECAVAVNITVALSFGKPGLFSYPARAYTGKIVTDSLGLPPARIGERFSFNNFTTDEIFAREALPKRIPDGNKGSFGRVLLITGSEKYRGAAHLTAEAALRGGAGLVSFAGDGSLPEELRAKFPEIIYSPLSEAAHLSESHRATLIGSGSGCLPETAALVRELLTLSGGALILDADAINSLVTFGGTELIKKSKRRIILTPHPLEFSRLTGISVAEVQAHRIEYAKKYAKENGCILVLKGAATVITDGEQLYINTSGSSALAKAGSGDVLAGLLLSLLGFSEPSVRAAALAAYIHGRAGDNLSELYSSFGVTPSDLPRECAAVISTLERAK